ncbi:MAG: hypothetical protein HYW15_02950 [Candidatus Giovannonibacteria bacterium]|nr:MAG: hypothetical protein HYW15_02950 [Candidatus Giovannonibacteria bacterium]
MWKQWTSGILGLLIMLLPYLSFPWGAHKITLFILGVGVAVLSFWSASEKEEKQL